MSKPKIKQLKETDEQMRARMEKEKNERDAKDTEKKKGKSLSRKHGRLIVEAHLRVAERLLGKGIATFTRLEKGALSNEVRITMLGFGMLKEVQHLQFRLETDGDARLRLGLPLKGGTPPAVECIGDLLHLDPIKAGKIAKWESEGLDHDLAAQVVNEELSIMEAMIAQNGRNQAAA